MILPAFIRHPKDFLTGLLFIAFGAAFILVARNYPLGSALRMGSGYFPTMLGGLLILIGLVTFIRSFFLPGEPIKGFSVKGLFIVIGSTILFGLLIRPAGLVIAIMVYVMLSSYASKDFKWQHSLALAIALAIFCVLIFIKALKVPLPLLGTWFGG